MLYGARVHLIRRDKVYLGDDGRNDWPQLVYARTVSQPIGISRLEELVTYPSALRTVRFLTSRGRLALRGSASKKHLADLNVSG